MFQLAGEVATTTEDIQSGREGYVRCMGELWRAKSQYNLKKDEKVRVVAIEGHVLVVEPLVKRKK